MNIKKQLGIGIMSAALGISLIGGGTFAYFSDSETTENTFAAGTLDLSAEPTEIINVDNIKPGDSMVRTFELHNDGSLDISRVYLDTEYTVDDAEGNNTEDFGEHIEVESSSSLSTLYKNSTSICSPKSSVLFPSASSTVYSVSR